MTQTEITLVDMAVELYMQTMPMSTKDTDDARFKEMYEKECELFSIMSQFDRSQSAEYKRRIKKETFKWRITKIKSFFLLPENHDFHDEGHGYIETTITWGGMEVTVYIYRDPQREIDFFVDTFSMSEERRVYDTRRQKERELAEQFKQFSNQ